MNCSVSKRSTIIRKALRAKGSQGFVRCLEVLQPVENLWKTCGKPVENLWKTCGKLVHVPAPLPYFYNHPAYSFFLCTFAFLQVLQEALGKYFPYFGYIGAIFTKSRTLSTKSVDAARSLPKFLHKKAG
jgi:hypothetical protein